MIGILRDQDLSIDVRKFGRQFTASGTRSLARIFGKCSSSVRVRAHLRFHLQACQIADQIDPHSLSRCPSSGRSAHDGAERAAGPSVAALLDPSLGPLYRLTAHVRADLSDPDLSLSDTAAGLASHRATPTTSSPMSTPRSSAMCWPSARRNEDATSPHPCSHTAKSARSPFLGALTSRISAAFFASISACRPATSGQIQLPH